MSVASLRQLGAYALIIILKGIVILELYYCDNCYYCYYGYCYGVLLLLYFYLILGDLRCHEHISLIVRNYVTHKVLLFL